MGQESESHCHNYCGGPQEGILAGTSGLLALSIAMTDEQVQKFGERYGHCRCSIPRPEHVLARGICPIHHDFAAAHV